MRLFKYSFVVTILITLFFIITPTKAAPTNSLEVVMFTRDGCVHCAAMKARLSTLQQTKYPQITLVEYEVYNHKENQPIFEQFSRAFNFPIVGVPVTIIGNNIIDGEDEARLEKLLADCQTTACPAPTELVKILTPTNNTPDNPNGNTEALIGWGILILLGLGIIAYIIFRLFKTKK